MGYTHLLYVKPSAIINRTARWNMHNHGNLPWELTGISQESVGIGGF